VVLGCEEAPSKDEEMPLATGCILHSKGETLPDNIAVIPDTTMYATNTESIVLDLYCMESEDEQKNTVSFWHTIELHGPQGEIVRIKSTFDNVAMVSALDLKVFQRSKHCLEKLQRSNRILRMADG
jgi:hypothetical protein